MTGPSTMAHHNELHAVIRRHEAEARSLNELLAGARDRLAEAERLMQIAVDWIGKMPWSADYRDAFEAWSDLCEFLSRSPPERESGDSMHSAQGGNEPGDGSAAARSGGETHHLGDGCAHTPTDHHGDPSDDDDPDDERECLG